MKITELIDLTNSDKPIQIRLLELHSPIFLAGTNLGAKLDVSRRTGLEIIYYKRVIYISYNDEASFFDALNAANIVPGTAKKADPLKSYPMVAGVSTSAQVGTPYDHVHGGPGKGKTK